MKLNRSAVNAVLLAVESSTAVVKTQGWKVPTFSLNKPNGSYDIIKMAAKTAHCPEEDAFYALSYVADKKLIRATWNSDRTEVTFISDLTADGHDYLEQLRKDGIIK